MKKLIALVLIVCSLSLLVACGVTKCDFCSEVKDCKEIEVQDDKPLICEDCLELYKDQIDQLNSK